MKQTFVLLLIILPLFLQGQNDEPNAVPTESTEETNASENTEELIRKVVKEVLQENSGTKKLGVCSSSKIGKKIKCADTGREVKLDSISIAIFDGVIQDIVIHVTDDTTGQSVIWNSTIISVPDFESRVTDRIGKGKGNTSKYSFMLEDVLTIESLIGKRGYVPEDVAFTLTEDNPVRILEINTDINSYLEARIYTDAFALFDDETPNGLVQTEISTRFFTRTQNSANKNTIWFNYLDMQLGFAKHDNDFSTLSLSEPADDGKFDIDRKILFQQSWAWVDINSNILNRWINKSHHKKFHWDIGISGYWSRVAEENNDSTIQNIFLPTYHTSIGFKLKRGENFGTNMELRAFAQRLTSDEGLIANNDWMYYLNPEIEIYYHPSGKKRNKIFLRYRNFINLSDNDDSLIGFEFQQLQIGYQYKFTNLFSK